MKLKDYFKDVRDYFSPEIIGEVNPITPSKKKKLKKALKELSETFETRKITTGIYTSERHSGAT